MVPLSRRPAPSSAQVRTDPPPRAADVAEGEPWRELVLISEGEGANIQRALARLESNVRLVRTPEDAVAALSNLTAGIILDAPLHDRTAEEALDSIAQVDVARRIPLFVVVDADFSDGRARTLYDAGATAVISWPREVLLLPRLISELLDVSLADHAEASIDTALTEATLARIAVDADLADDVTCTVRNGVAVVEGAVDSLWKLRRVIQRISLVPGITSIDDRKLSLNVASVEDRALEESLRTMMAVAPSVEDSTLSVSAQDGEVTLAGVVDSRSARRRLEQMVEGVQGVHSISNLLSVSSKGVETGKDHADALQNLLDRAFGQAKVTASVFGSVAVLTGNAPTLAARTDIVEAVEDAGFVDRVVDKIEVGA